MSLCISHILGRTCWLVHIRMKSVVPDSDHASLRVRMSHVAWFKLPARGSHRSIQYHVFAVAIFTSHENVLHS